MHGRSPGSFGHLPGTTASRACSFFVEKCYLTCCLNNGFRGDTSGSVPISSMMSRRERYDIDRAVPLTRLLSALPLFQELVVVRVGANPEPDDSLRPQNADSAIILANAHRINR